MAIQHPRQSLAELAWTPLRLLGTLADVPLRAVQRLVGIGWMPYVFLLPNLGFFGIFVVLPLFINFAFSLTGGTNLFLSDRVYVGTEQYGFLLDCENFVDSGSCREDRFWRGNLQHLRLRVVPGLLPGAVLAGHRADPEPGNPRPGVLPGRVLLPGAAVAGCRGARVEVDSAAGRHPKRLPGQHRAGEDPVLRQPGVGDVLGDLRVESGRTWASTR